MLNSSDYAKNYASTIGKSLSATTRRDLACFFAKFWILYCIQLNAAVFLMRYLFKGGVYFKIEFLKSLTTIMVNHLRILLKQEDIHSKFQCLTFCQDRIVIV